MANKDSSGSPETGAELPAIDFSTFVLSLSASVLYQMGLAPGPEGERRPEANPLLARQTIDTLEMIRDKTRGNLDSEEVKLLDSLLYELHTQFVALENQ